MSLKPRSIIEMGCGLARDSFVLASKRFNVTILDYNPRVIQLAKKNNKNLGLNLKIIKGDFLRLRKSVKYDIVFHSGVLEHFDDKDIMKILHNQLKIAPLVIFSVPLWSKFNEKYFKEKERIFRRLLTKREWSKILSSFHIIEARKVHDRHDDLLVTIGR